MKISYLIVTIIAVILIPITSSSSKVINKSEMTSSNGQDASDALTDKNTITINKTSFSLQDTLVVTLAQPHSKQLGLKTPGGEYFFIAGSPKNELKSNYSSKEYSKLRALKFPIKEFKAVPYEYNAKDKIAVFAVPGIYEFQVGDNLESDLVLTKKKFTINIK